MAIGILAVVVVSAITGWIILADDVPQGKDGPWIGVDVSVIERYAAEAGRKAGKPIINTGQGDLLLFVFAASGAVGGFIAGYCWRRLISERNIKKGS